MSNISDQFKDKSMLQKVGCNMETMQLPTCLVIKVRIKEKLRNPYNQILKLAQETIWESGENTREHHIQESHYASLFPAGDYKDARNSQDSMTRNTNYNKTHKRSTIFERSVRKSLDHSLYLWLLLICNTVGQASE